MDAQLNRFLNLSPGDGLRLTIEDLEVELDRNIELKNKYETLLNYKKQAKDIVNNYYNEVYDDEEFAKKIVEFASERVENQYYHDLVANQLLKQYFKPLMTKQQFIDFMLKLYNSHYTRFYILGLNPEEYLKPFNTEMVNNSLEIFNNFWNNRLYVYGNNIVALIGERKLDQYDVAYILSMITKKMVNKFTRRYLHGYDLFDGENLNEITDEKVIDTLNKNDETGYNYELFFIGEFSRLLKNFYEFEEPNDYRKYNRNWINGLYG